MTDDIKKTLAHDKMAASTSSIWTDKQMQANLEKMDRIKNLKVDRDYAEWRITVTDTTTNEIKMRATKLQSKRWAVLIGPNLMESLPKEG